MPPKLSVLVACTLAFSVTDFAPALVQDKPTTTVPTIADQKDPVDSQSTDVNPACRPVSGLDDLLKPGQLILLGEQHGTAQSPAFLLDLTCHTVQSSLPLTVGLELDSREQKTANRYLDSEGSLADRRYLVASEIWQRNYQDGRNSTAMADVIEGLRLLRQEGHRVSLVLFDHPGQNRETRMAESLAQAANQNLSGVTLVLTGNRHSRAVRGGRFDPMGYRLVKTLGQDQVISLDVAHQGGSSWLCFATSEGQDCGKAKLRGRGPQGLDGVSLFESVGSNGHHGWYGIGEIEASPPAKTGFMGKQLNKK